MLKRTVLALVSLVLLITLAGCPEPGGTAPTTQDPTAFDTLEAVFDVTDKTAETVSYVYDSDTGDTVDVEGYGLDLFVTQAAVGALVSPDAATDLSLLRSMFAYNVVASDDYGFMTRGDALGWSDLEGGYYLYDGASGDGTFTAGDETEDPRVYFASDDIARSYDVSNPVDVELYRAVNVVLASDATVNSLVLTDSFVTETLAWVKYRGEEGSDQSNAAVALEDLLYEFFQANESDSSPRADATYLVKCADYDATDDYTFEELTYEQLAAAYFMPGTATMDADGEYEDQIVVMTGETDDGIPSNDSSSLRLKLPVTIEVTW